MKLYSSLTSPYGRITRIALIEKGLADQIPLEVPITRQPDSPYYAINPSGRVPYLLLDDGTGLEESALICEYLDRIGSGEPLLAPPDESGFEARRVEATARSMLDGLSVWSRELTYREPKKYSQTLIAHESARAHRLADRFEALADGPVLSGPLNLAQITLACVLHGRDKRPPGFEWRAGRPALSAWIERMGQRESVASTAPPNSQA